MPCVGKVTVALVLTAAGGSITVTRELLSAQTARSAPTKLTTGLPLPFY